MTDTAPTTSTPPATLRLLVPDEETQVVAAEDAPLQPREFREEGAVDWVRKRILKNKDIAIDDAKAELGRVDAEVDSWLGALRTQTAGGYKLNEVQVGVVISAQGGIGIVTAGIQASVTLVYSRA